MCLLFYFGLSKIYFAKFDLASFRGLGSDNFVYFHGEMPFDPLLLAVNILDDTEFVSHILFELHINFDQLDQILEPSYQFLGLNLVQASVEQSLQRELDHVLGAHSYFLPLFGVSLDIFVDFR